MDASALQNRDYYVIIDKSGSMDEKDCPGGVSRWKYVEESVLAISRKLQEYDPDGITVITFSGSYKMYPNTTPDKVRDVFRENSPMGGTKLAAPLQAMFDQYLSEKKAGTAKANGVIAFVITDGCPSDEAETEGTIINFTKKLDRDEEFGIEFLQVGTDAHASAWLRDRLDNGLEAKGAKFDIVNVHTIDDMENLPMEEVMLSALTD